MTAAQATAEVFMTAFRALPRKERAAVLAELAQDSRTREDLFDLTVLQSRRGEPSRPLDQYMQERRDAYRQR